MKRNSGWLIGIILLSSFLVYCKPILKDSVVVIPDFIAAKVIDELIVGQGLKYSLHITDSILTVTNSSLTTERQKVQVYKLKEEEYKNIISQYTELTSVKDMTIKQQTKLLRKARFKIVLLKAGLVIETVIIVLILI